MKRFVLYLVALSLMGCAEETQTPSSTKPVEPSEQHLRCGTKKDLLKPSQDSYVSIQATDNCVDNQDSKLYVKWIAGVKDTQDVLDGRTIAVTYKIVQDDVLWFDCQKQGDECSYSLATHKTKSIKLPQRTIGCGTSKPVVIYRNRSDKSRNVTVHAKNNCKQNVYVYHMRDKRREGVHKVTPNASVPCVINVAAYDSQVYERIEFDCSATGGTGCEYQIEVH